MNNPNYGGASMISKEAKEMYLAMKEENIKFISVVKASYEKFNKLHQL
jgi:hypothetical protein